MDDDQQVIDVTALPPQGTPCQACGNPLEAADRFCPACAQPNPATEIPAGRDAAVAQQYFRCEACGSEMAADPDQRSYVCPFCDSTYVVEFARDMTDRQPPEFVIGFGVTREQAQEKFRQWLGSNSWFRPGDLNQAQAADKMKGIYLPFWSFSMLAQSEWMGKIGEYWYRTETYTTTQNGKTVTKTRRVRETEWWDLSGRHHQYYSGYLVSGSKGLSQREADRVKPFQLPALKRYEPFYLAGWLSEEYTVARDAALAQCQREFYEREQRQVARFMPGDAHRKLDVSTTFHQVNSDLCLLPIYLLSYRYKDKLFRFMINGQTGKVSGDKPVSWRRILLLVGAVGVFLLLTILLIVLLKG